MEWISVKDRLPESTQIVIAVRFGEVVPVMYRSPHEYHANGFLSLYLESRMPKVTHWMPLPTPPEGE